MAVTISITDGTTTVALSSDDTSWQLLSRWEPVVATPTGDGSIPGYVTDVLPVIITPTTDNNLAAELQDLHALQKQAAEYWADENQVTPVWFQRKLNTETGTAQTLVRSIDFDVDVRFGSWIDNCPAITDGRLGNVAITHHPTWETTSAVAASGATGISILGGSFDYTDVVGDFSARPYYIRYYGGDAGAVFQYAWLGFRSDARCGASTNGAADYTALWECEAGTPGGADASETTDATASPGGGGNTKTRITFATQTGWYTAPRFTVALDQIEGTAAQIPAYFGTFIVLFRAKIDSGTAQVKIEQRGLGALTSVFGPIVDISATSYTIYNLGTVTFPMRDRKAIPLALLAAEFDDDELLGLWARVKSGSPSALDCDCFILIPIDEYFVLIGNIGVTTDIEAYLGVSPVDNWAGVSLDVSTIPDRIQDICPVSINGAGIPVGDGRAFICTANASLVAPPITDDIDMQVSTYPRWLSLRGVE